MTTGWRKLFTLERVENLSVRRRLALLIGVCSGLTALLCMLSVLVTSIWLANSRGRELTVAITRMTAVALQVPVAFGDRKAVADALTMLQARAQVRGAWVFDADGKEIGRYGQAPPPEQFVPGSLRHGYMMTREPVQSEAGEIGSVLTVVDLGEGWQFLAIAMGAILAGALVALLVSSLLAQRISRRISRPITQLAATASAISRSQDYSQRLPPGGGDEIGTAVNAFNNMLAELQQRGTALLELRVADRTRLLEVEKERAVAASVAKTTFLSNMSHELRTPLNAVIGAAQLLDERGLADPAQAHLLTAIRDSGSRLLGLIENVLDLSRIESGALDLAREPFNLVECVEAAVSTAAVQARIKGLHMHCVVSPQVQEWRVGDALRLRQVLLNLLGNAVKFTLQGEVSLQVVPAASPQALSLVVQDTGIGMDVQAQRNIFEPFRQADSSTTRRFGGSGLGLSISRQLVQAMGGRIEVSSTPGQGSRFEVTLPLPVAPHQAGETPAPLGYTVLAYEPRAADAKALQATLARMGCNLALCKDAAELTRRLLALPAGTPEPWLLVAVDDEGAWPLLEEAMPLLNPERVIGMSQVEAYQAEQAREHVRVPRHVIKPVLRTALVSRFGAVERHLAWQAEGVQRAYEPTQPAALDEEPQREVLVVEDDTLNQMIVCTMLQNAGCRTTTADDGHEALRLLRQRRFDLVLMDWQMPGMDGLEVTRQLRAGAAGRFGQQVPVVALTANAFVEDRAACLAAGMNDFLTKPVLATSLEAAVNRWAKPATRIEPPTSSAQAFAPLQ